MKTFELFQLLESVLISILLRDFIVVFFSADVLQGSSTRLVVPDILGKWRVWLLGNSKPIYEVCDFKSENSAPKYCI